MVYSKPRENVGKMDSFSPKHSIIFLTGVQFLTTWRKKFILLLKCRTLYYELNSLSQFRHFVPINCQIKNYEFQKTLIFTSISREGAISTKIPLLFNLSTFWLLSENSSKAILAMFRNIDCNTRKKIRKLESRRKSGWYISENKLYLKLQNKKYWKHRIK